MDNSWFFEKFELIAELPDAIPRMRELVLELAFKGAFHENTSWQMTELGTVCKRIHYGYTAKADPINQTVRMLRITDIQNNHVNWCTVPGCEITETDLSKYQLQEGDVLIARTGGTVGKSFLIRERPPTAVFASYLIRLVPTAEILPDYLKRFLESPTYWAQLYEGARGAAQPNVNGKTLSQIQLPLPPLSEQHRIVSKVEELLGICDRLEEEQREREGLRGRLVSGALKRFSDTPSVENLGYLFHGSYGVSPSDLRKTILTLAVQGKLVPQDPKEGSAEELLDLSLAKKSSLVESKEIKKEDDLPGLDKEACNDIPPNWLWCRVGKLCYPISSGSTPNQSEFKTTAGVPYLKVYNIRNQKIDFEYKPQYISVEYHQKKMKRSILKPGDVVMNIVGPPLGKVAIIPDGYPEWNCNQAIAFFRFIEPDIAPFFYTFLNEGSFLTKIQLIGTAGQDNISVTKCKMIPIPLPPLSEQRRIVAKVEELMTMVDELEQMELQTRQRSASLLDAIVHRLSASAG